jgi:hypothetical protein
MNFLRYGLAAFALVFYAAPSALKADVLAAINTQTDAATSSVVFFDPTSLALTSSFGAPVVLEGLTFGATSNDVYTSAGNTVYHYDQNGNLLGSGSVGKSDVVELSYYNGALYAATNTGNSSAVTVLDPTTLNAVSSFDASDVNPLVGISVTGAGIYVTSGSGIVLFDFSGNVINSVPFAPFGPVSAIPGGVFTSAFSSPGYTIFFVLPDFSDGFPITSTPGVPGIAAIDTDNFFLSDGSTIGFLSDINPENAYFGAEADNFGNLAYTPSPEPGTFVLIGLAAAGLMVYRARAAIKVLFSTSLYLVILRYIPSGR